MLKRNHNLFAVAALFLSFMSLSPVAYSEPFTWQDLNHDLRVNSLMLKRETLDVKIADKDVADGRMAYLPTVQFQGNMERLEDLSPEQVNNSSPTSIGDSFILNRSITQNSASLGVDYVVLDFGKRKSKVASSVAMRDAETYQVDSTVRNLQLEIMPIFAQIWQLQQEGRLLKQQLTLRNQKLTMLKRLEAAGEIGKVPVYEEALQVLNVQQQLEQRQQRLLRELQSLTKYTHRNYTPEQYEFSINKSSGLSSPTLTSLKDGETSALDLTNYPEVKELEARMIQKGEEIKYVQRQRWSPDLSVYGRLIAYGSDGSNLGDSIKDFDFRNSRLGVQLRMPISQAYTLKPREEKLKLEHERLALELEERKQVLQLEWSSNEAQAEALNSMQQTVSASETKINELVQATDRLTKAKVLTPLNALETELKKSETELAQIRLDAQRWVVETKRDILASAIPADSEQKATGTSTNTLITKTEETKHP